MMLGLDQCMVHQYLVHLCDQMKNIHLEERGEGERKRESE